MLMVIFGAGASYDSVPSIPILAEDEHEDRPPLANQLFDTRQIFSRAMARFGRCLPIVPYLQARDTPVERVLEKLREEAAEYPERHRQLAAIRYYLQYALWDLQHRWDNVAQGVSNYKTLIDQIQRWRRDSQQICLATFNYDTMLEAALPTVGINIQNMNDYIANEDYKIIKLHGSINWAREIVADIKGENPGSICYNVIEQAADLAANPDAISTDYRIATGPLIGKVDGKVLFPALAIPVETKLSFECPEQHLNVLRECARKTTKLLIIGWRGMEKHFLALLAENLPQGIPAVIVSGSAVEASNTLLRIGKARIIINSARPPLEFGFSEFVVQRIGDDFLKI